MPRPHLSENLKVNVISETPKSGVFEIEGLYSGYGTTLGNGLRRVLLSSLPGAAITQVKIKNVGHEFTTIPGVVEDVVEIMLNLKRVRFLFNVDYAAYEQPELVTLSANGEGKVTAASIKNTNLVKVINPETHIATITDKNTELEMELTIEKGLGYVPVESFKTETLPVGVIQLDAIFSPITKVNFTVENMRVGDRTDFNRLRFVIETDGSISPSSALHKAASLLQDHFGKIYDQISATTVSFEAIGVSESASAAASGKKKKPAAKKTAKKKMAKKE